jgi:hypothetical protein
MPPGVRHRSHCGEYVIQPPPAPNMHTPSPLSHSHARCRAPRRMFKEREPAQRAPTAMQDHAPPCGIAVLCRSTVYRRRASLVQVAAAAQFRRHLRRYPAHAREPSSSGLSTQPISRPPLRCSRTATRRATGASGRACLPTTSLIVPLAASSEEEVRAFKLAPRRGPSNAAVQGPSDGGAPLLRRWRWWRGSDGTLVATRCGECATGGRTRCVECPRRRIPARLRQASWCAQPPSEPLQSPRRRRAAAARSCCRLP